MDAKIIRIDAKLLDQHQNQIVRIIGKCELSDPTGGTASLICNGTINLISEDHVFVVGKNYEVIGKTGATSLEVKVYSALELSDNVNIDIALKLAHYIHKVPELYTN